jgi:hypothetical protein
MSGHGGGSFRGKVYSTFIEDVSGESLYQKEIPNETVEKIADALEDYEWDGTEPDSYWAPDDRGGFEALCQMFRYYADEGAYLVGWW